MENKEMIGWVILAASALLLFRTVRKLPKATTRLILIIILVQIVLFVGMSIFMPEVLVKVISWFNVNLKTE